MGVGSAILSEAWEDRTPQLFLAALLLVTLIAVLAPHERKRMRGSIVLFGLHLLLIPVAGVLRAQDSPYYREVRLSALIFGVLAIIFLAATFAFSVAAARLRVHIPRILQDVIVAAAFLIAVFLLASHAGLNLSGLIATSAVLTAVIGLAFQDTLGNVVGGLALQLDNSIRVGDWVKIGDVGGRVTEIRWRYTAIETRNWETVIVPNSQLVKNQVVVLGRRVGQPMLWRRWVYFNVDFRYAPSEVIEAVTSALVDVDIENVAKNPKPHCILMDLNESFARYAVRYWLQDLAIDDPTDSLIRTRIYFALKRAAIPLSMPAHAIFLTEESAERRDQKSRENLEHRLESLSKVDLLHVISEDERRSLAASLRYAPFARGEVITRQGAEAHWLYIITQGQAAVRLVGEEGVEREVARLNTGDFFGEMSLLTGERRSATVVALSNVECYRLDREAFKELLERRPQIAEQVADVLAKRRVELTAVKENLSQAAKRERLQTTKLDLLGKMRAFFALGDDGRPELRYERR